MKFNTYISALAVVLAGLAPGAASARSPESYGKRLAALRAKVDRLEATLADVRARAAARERALAGERARLSLKVTEARARAAALRRTVAAERARARARAEADRAALPALRRAIAAVDRAVAEGLPFMVEARRRRLAEIRADLEAGRADAVTVAERLRRFVEDEVVLSGQVGRHRQVITLDGERLLVDVARLGLGLLFFAAPDGRVGFAEPAGQGRHRFRAVRDDAARRGIRALFAALARRLRSGLHALPLPPPPKEAR